MSFAETGALASFAEVVFEWPGRERFRLEIADWRLEPAERVALVGPSGAGKSTLVNLLAGVTTPTSGRLTVLGRDLGAMRPGARDRFRADHIGLVFQLFNLLPYGDALDNVALALAFSPRRRAAVAEPKAEARRLLGALGLPEALFERPVSTLSVGQQQRVAAARALIGRPALVLADEPTSALDAPTRDAFLELLFAESAAAGAAVLVVTHDEAVARRFDRILPLETIARAGRMGAAA